MSAAGALPAFSGGGSAAGSGGVNVPNPIHLPPVAGVPAGPAPTEAARAFAGATTLARANESVATSQTSLVSAAGKYIPVAYGNCRWSGLCYFFEVHPTSGALVIGLLLSAGEIGDVLRVEVNNEPLRSGCSFAAYTGASGQVADPTIAALLAARTPALSYTETLAGLAHVVVTLGASAYAPGEIHGVDVRFLGKKLFDPRDATQSKTVPSSWRYSANAALVLADFLSSGYAVARGVVPQYGRRCRVTDSSVVAAANFNDELIGNPPNTRKRSEVHAVLLAPTANEVWEQSFRTHARCYVDRLGDDVELIPDVVRAAVASFDETQIIKFERVSERTVGAAPTMMEATFTDTSVTPWRERTVRIYDPRVLTGEIPEVNGRVDLRMCQSYAQAQALLRFRLNTTTLSVRSWGVSLGGEGYALQKSDVISISHPLGMTAKQWVVDTVADRGFGEVHLKLSEYDAGAFAAYFQPNPATLGSGVSACVASPALTGMSVSARLLMELQPGGAYACIRRAVVQWDASSYPCLAAYEVDVLSGATVVDSALVGVNSYLSAPLAAGSYTVRVRATSAVQGQAAGSWSTAALTIGAGACPPLPPVLIWEAGSHSNLYFKDTIHNAFMNSHKFTRIIRCSAPLTSVTRTELWFGWGANPTFATATKVRDDAGAQTAWTFERAWVPGSGNVSWGDARYYCTLALGTSASVPTYVGGGFNDPGASPAGTYADALASYAGPVFEWMPPTKVWVRFVDGATASAPAELALAKATLTYPDGAASVSGFMFSGAKTVVSGDFVAGSHNTGYGSKYATFVALSGNLTYGFLSPNHLVGGQLFDEFGDLVSGDVRWQAWTV